MSKYQKLKKISKSLQERLLIELCYALISLKNPKEAAMLLVDLLGEEEIIMIAKRLQIAKLLIQGMTYKVISRTLFTSEGTIARVNEWLNESGEGYRLIIQRLKKKKIKTTDDISPYSGFIEPGSWAAIKRRYPLHFLFFNIYDDIIKSIRETKRKEIEFILKKFKKTNEKSFLFKELNNIISRKYKNYHTT